MMGRLLIIVSLLMLSGCGFHLRESVDLPREIQRVAIHPDKAWDPFQRILQQQLRQAGAEIGRKSANTTLEIVSAQEMRNTVAYGADGQPHRIRLNLKIEFILRTPDGEPLIDQHAVQAVREYTVDPKFLIQSEEEERIVLEEVREEAAAALIRRLNYLL